MNPDDQPSTPSKPPGASRAGASGMWQAPSVEEMQAMLPQYEILEILGRGGMGAVYKGRQKSLKRLVAIKILPPDAADDEMRFVERFENEAQTMAAMNHPAIVSVYDFGETAEGLLYFIMEFVDGTDVHKMIQTSGKLGDDYALAITAHVCDALDYAHSRGVIHRDIKPANILIDQEGRVKVADFGLAKVHDPSMTSGLTRTNMAMGTPDYVAPEVLSMGMVVDHRADLYAVGVMLYQMLTGEVPRGMFRMPSEKGIGTDPRFDEIICKAMESDREHRYQTASEVRHALDVILTTPQPENDGTGVVPLEAIPKKVVLNVPGGPIGQSAVVPSRSQASPPKKVAGKAVAAKGAPAKVAPAKGPASPSGKSSTGLWVTVVGVAAAIAVAAIFLMGGKPEPAAKVQPASAGSVSTSPVDAAFLAQVAAAPAARQVELVEQKIEALNGTQVSSEPTITGEKVTGLRLFRADDTEGEVSDITPLAALKDLDLLHLQYLYPRDISCLRGLKLVNLTIWGGHFDDVSVLQSLPLQTLSLKQIKVSDFSVLKGKALQRLDLELCDRLSDLSFVKGMPLKYLFVPKTKVRDLSPIAGSPLIELVCDTEAKLDPALLASIPTLKKINTKPVSDWLIGSGNLPPSAAPGKTIDLLALVDVNRDAVAGQWVRTADGLVKTGGIGDGPRLQLPYQPAEEYDFEIEFTPTGGNGNIGQILAAQGREFGWMLNTGDQGNHRAGFGLLDGKKTIEVTETTAPLKEGIVDGRRYHSRVEVRAGRLRAFLDDTEIVNWTGDFSRLANDVTGKLRDSGHIGLRLNRDAVFHKITVREITGKGKLDAGVVAAPSTTTPSTEEAGKSAPGKSARAPLASTAKDAPFENSLGMKFVPVPGTEVLFCIHETRYRDYAEHAKMAKTSGEEPWKIQTHDGFEIKTSAGDHPVASVNWNDAQAFCKWLSEKEGLTYRLPTDREWSLAVGIGRGEDWKSDTTPATVFQVPDVYPWGKDWPPPQGAGNYSDESRRAKAPRADTTYVEDYNDGFPTTAPVMSFEANPLGLFDLGGNVWEWCEAWHSDERKQRVLRGGSWTNVERGLLLSSIRERYSPEIRRYNYGFRVVLEIAASTSPTSAANSAVAPPSAHNTAPTSPSGRTVDLLALVDVKRDTFTGEWSRDGGDLLVKAAKPDANGTPRLQLPYQPPEEYDFEIEFTPESGTHMVFQILSAYQRSFAWLMDSQLTSGSKAGIDSLDGLPVSSRNDGTILRPKFLTNGQRYRSIVEVRRTGLRALLNGEPLVKWGSDPKSYERLDISPNQKLRDALHLGLSTYDRRVRFHKITVREITGAGKVDAGIVAATAPGPASAWTDWLGPRLARPGGFDGGQWKREPEGFTTEKSLAGYEVLPADTRDGAMKVTFAMRDSQGVMINIRETKVGTVQQRYTAQFTGTSLYLAHGNNRLASEPMQGELRDLPEHTLEFRFEGENLIAILNDTHRISTRHSQLTEGSCALVLTKGVVVKKIEVQALQPPR